MTQRYTLLIGNRNYSSWSLRPWMVLKHFALDFTERCIKFDTEEFTRAVAAFSPARKVPVLAHGEARVWESLAIMEYLAEQHPDLPVWPRDSARRARARVLAAEMHAGFDALRHAMPMNCRATGRQVPIDAPLARDIARIDGIWRECLNDHHGPWLFGEFSAVDAMYLPVASRFHTYAAELSPAAAVYRDTARTHPAYQEWLAVARSEPEVVADEEIGRAN